MPMISSSWGSPVGALVPMALLLLTILARFEDGTRCFRDLYTYNGGERRAYQNRF